MSQITPAYLAVAVVVAGMGWGQATVRRLFEGQYVSNKSKTIKNIREQTTEKTISNTV